MAVAKLYTEVYATLQSAGLLLPGTIHATLDEASIGRQGRLIVIGDVHGCVVELRELLAKVGFSKGNDTVVLVGDSVDKGPHSLEVGSAAWLAHGREWYPVRGLRFCVSTTSQS